MQEYTIFCLKTFFTCTNSVAPDEMQHYAAFHLGLHCLQKYSFRGFPEYKGLMQVTMCVQSPHQSNVTFFKGRVYQGPISSKIFHYTMLSIGNGSLPKNICC